MKEADKKVWIVPGKIRVASVFFALIVATVVTTAGRCAEKRPGSTGASGRGSVAVPCSCEQRQQERPGSEVGGAGCSVILFKRSTS